MAISVHGQWCRAFPGQLSEIPARRPSARTLKACVVLSCDLNSLMVTL